MFKRFRAKPRDVVEDPELAQKDEQELRWFHKFFHFWVLVGRSFGRNRCPVRASALAYASLLAMVPMLAVAISVSSSLLKRQGEEPIARFIDQMVASLTPDASIDAGTATPSENAAAEAQQVKVRKEAARRIMEFVGNIRSGTLTVTGMVALLVVAISMLSRIEDTFNDIWGVTRGRSWFSRIVLYWAAISLGPIMLITALALTSGPHFKKLQDFVEHLPWGGFMVKAGLVVLPFAILTVAFSLFYYLMPNTKVQWRAALVGGLLGGCLWQLNNEISVLYVSRVVSNSRIYGSLGMVPVFMIGLYFSWMILLFGAQVAYAYQNRGTYFQERRTGTVNHRSREFVALRFMAAIGLRFRQGEKPPKLNELATSVGVPSRLAGQVLGSLAAARLLTEVVASEPSYQVARPLEAITADDILQALRDGEGRALATRAEPSRETVREEFERIAAAERQTASAITLRQLVDRLAAA
jgi:membrane protein